MRQHTSAYVSIRHADSIRQHTSGIRQAYVSIRHADVC
jgi:hypothetical protein